MRKMIIDTDCGSDDAVALMIACLDPDTELLGITTVHGNVPLKQATLNALQTVEMCGRNDVPVYIGEEAPLMRKPVNAMDIHGNDGMGDLGLIHPDKRAEEMPAVDFILESVRKYPDEIELVTLGPVTNIGRCIEKDRDTMNRLKRIVSMATTGLGPGNTTPVSEFNVYADAEAFRLLLGLDTDKLFVGFDMCVGDNAWNEEDIREIGKEGTLGSWAVAVNDGLLKFNASYGMVRLDLPDAVAISCVCWPDTVIKEMPCYAYCCVIEEATYGQVIFYNESMMLSGSGGLTYPDHNCRLVTAFDGRRFAEYCKQILKRKLIN